LETTSKFKVTTEEKTITEAMLGGVSNGGPAPGHRAKMNEESPYSSFEWFEQDRPHRIDILQAKQDLSSYASDIASSIEEMHIPEATDKMTEKMIKNKLANIYAFLKKVKNLTN